MNAVPEKGFLKDVRKISDPKKKAEIEQAILTVKKAASPKDIPGLKKVTGEKPPIFYRIRVGDYRIGVTIECDLVTFVRCLPRKDIYKYFP